MAQAMKTRKNKKARGKQAFSDEVIARALAVLRMPVSGKLISSNEMKQLQYSLKEGSDRGKSIAIEAADCVELYLQAINSATLVEAWWDTLRDYQQDALSAAFPAYGQRRKWMSIVKPALDWIQKQEDEHNARNAKADEHKARDRREQDAKKAARKQRDRELRSKMKGGASKK